MLVVQQPLQRFHTIPVADLRFVCRPVVFEYDKYGPFIVKQILHGNAWSLLLHNIDDINCKCVGITMTP